MADSKIYIPKEVPRWLYEAFRRLSQNSEVATSQIAAIGRGEAPDGSGLPLFDTSKFFFLPGLIGGQTAIQIDYLSPLLTLTQAVPTAGAEPLLVLDSFGKLMRMTTESFTIANCSTTISSPTVITAGTFIVSGGPSVVPGMRVSGSGIPANTFVRTLPAGNTLTMTNDATASDVVTLTFTTEVDIQPRTDDTGRDIEWLVRGAIRFTTGTDNIPFRINGEVLAIASGITAAPRVFLETGYLLGGSSFGTDFQIGGPQHGELSHMNIWARTLWLSRSPASGSDNCVGIGSENPATYGAGLGPAASLIVGNNRGPATFIGSTSGGPILQVRDVSGGTSPNRTLGSLIFGVDRDNSLGFYPIRFENAGGSGVYFRAAGNDNLICYQKSNDLEMFSFGRVSLWSDSLAIANSFIHTLGTVNGGHRAYILTSSGNGSFTRFGLRSNYILFGNGDPSSSDFPAPEAAPTLFRLYENFADDRVVMKIETPRTGKTADMLQIIGAITNQVNTTFNARNVFATGRIKTDVLFTDDPATIANGKLFGFDTATLITAGQTRIVRVQDYSGTLMVVGNDAPAVAAGSLGKVDSPGQTADIASTNLSNGAVTGVMYLVEMILQCTTAAGGAGTLTLTTTATEATGARNVSVAKALTTTGTVSNVGRWLLSSGEISFTATILGAYNGAVYAVYIRVIPLE